MGHPTATQDSLPDGRPAFPGGIDYPLGPNERFQVLSILLSQASPGALNLYVSVLCAMFRRHVLRVRRRAWRRDCPINPGDNHTRWASAALDRSECDPTLDPRLLREMQPRRTIFAVATRLHAKISRSRQPKTPGLVVFGPKITHEALSCGPYSNASQGCCRYPNVCVSSRVDGSTQCRSSIAITIG